MDHRLKNFLLANSSYGCIACVRVHPQDQIICVINGEHSGGIVHLLCENKRNGGNTSLENELKILRELFVLTFEF